MRLVCFSTSVASSSRGIRDSFHAGFKRRMELSAMRLAVELPNKEVRLSMPSLAEGLRR